MSIGMRLRKIRESKHLSQGDVERRTGVLRVYTSRVENGHTMPSLPMLERYARGLEVPLYRLFYDDERPPTVPIVPATKVEDGWGASGKDRRQLRQFVKAISRLDDRDRSLLVEVAVRMAGRRRAR